MTFDGKFLAWIEDKNDQKFIAHFVGSAVKTSRPPATLSFNSRRDAQLWVELEAEAVGLPVEWVSPSI